MAVQKNPPPICIVCQLPIEDHQLPAIEVSHGRQIHVECYEKWKEQQRKVN